ncbi:DUF3326 domain-containing protein [Oscillatoria sp. CS-180]|uniref:DUF3326 domain-containing protein n=1 Tax=Oscillatoria sp. CS-180 TaxID=3021720 RepID=UPI00233128E8|nr:DUF3326 domain-containing protein [Oscillatoria sp. CS-180]MDB9524670.1 DUF3326 domain-containing protein [Oscillatoria sp. CS-180]
MRSPYTAVLIVPTGVAATMGGYAGDALPIARAIAQVADTLITHPNVMNGAQLYWPLPNGLYVEGYGLDQFAAGRWGLRPVHCNRIGLILDAGIEEYLRYRHLQAADAARATLGLAMTDYVVTDAPVNVTLKTAVSGSSWGTVSDSGTLLRAAEKLMGIGAEAIAVVVRFPDDEDSEALQNYRQGQGVDPLAGAEAVISHLVVRAFQVPCAHAPALQPLPLDPALSPKSAAEEIGHTFLPCVLAGLSRAPQFITDPISSPNALWRDQVDAVIVPATACGGSGVLSLSSTQAQIIAVEENDTALSVSPEQVGIGAIRVRSYLEAIGVMAAHKAGISSAAIAPKVLPLKSA